MLTTLSKCTVRESCCNYLLRLKCEDLLASMAKSHCFQVGNNAKIILSSLSHCLPSQYQSSIELTTKELMKMLQSLHEVLELGVGERDLYFSALEIIQHFNFLTQFEPNRNIVAYSAVYKSIACLLRRGNVMEQKAACELLWNLVTKSVDKNIIDTTPMGRHAKNVVNKPNPHEYMAEPNIKSFILQNYPEVLTILSTLSTQGGNTEALNVLFSCTFSVLTQECEEIGKGEFVCTCP